MAYALLSGDRPLLFKNTISWDCFIADRGLVRCSHQPHDASISAFVDSRLDSRLKNVLRDLHAFSCLSNLAYQTTRKLSPALYNEMMVSILYRLTHLSFWDEAVQETIRLGLLVFASTVFLQRQYAPQRFDRLLELYNKALFELCHLQGLDLPAPISLWLTILPHLVSSARSARKDWHTEWLADVILQVRVEPWTQACGMLRSIAWVDFIHDQPGKHAFSLAKVPQPGGDQAY